MSYGLQGGGSGFGVATGLEAYSGGKKYFVLTAAMSTTAQLVSGQGGRLAKIFNSSGGAATITVYDAASQDATTLSTAQKVVTAQVLPTTGIPLDLQIPMTNGIVVKAGSAVANDILITFS